MKFKRLLFSISATLVRIDRLDLLGQFSEKHGDIDLQCHVVKGERPVALAVRFSP